MKQLEKIRIGLDLSINSTGVTIVYDNNIDYHIITNKITKAQQQCDYITYHQYDKSLSTSKDSYIYKEQDKTHNIYNIVKIIEQILFNTYKIDKYKDIRIQIEGVAFGASGDVVGLSGLNYQVRYMLLEHNINFNIISPMQLKKAAVGNGGADKSIMMDAFKRITNFDNKLNVKIDDIADAYFLAVIDFFN